MRFIQRYCGWKIYQVKDGYKARQGAHWSGLFKSIAEAKESIRGFTFRRQAQATKG